MDDDAPDESPEIPPIDSFEFESRIVADGYAYWVSKVRDGRLPGRTAIHPAEIPRLLPDVMLIDVRREPAWDFRFRLVGTRIVEHMHRDFTGMWMSETDEHGTSSAVWANFRTVAETGAPLFPATPYTGPREEFRRAEDIILPLSEDGRTVDGLLVFVAFHARL